jgi:glyoxylase-like metal-dependent hydrolase (beta-lactamase superfamily II)
MALKYKVFRHSYLGFNSTSTLFYGENDAVLIDASQLISDSYKMIAEIIPMRKRITHIYVSHFHPDHHFGVDALKYAFPGARIVSMEQSAHDIVATTNDKIGMWAGERFGDDFPRSPTIPFILGEPKLDLEGEEILFYGPWHGDSVNNSIVWAPSLKLICASDMAFHDVYAWTVESDFERRKLWRKDITRMLDLDPRVIIPGHCDEAKIALIEEVAQDESREYIDCAEWTIKYLDIYDEAYQTAKTGKDLVDKVRKYYDFKGIDFGLQWQARLLFPNSCPDWYTPLPAPPGKVFLNPSGGFDGDPCREIV